MPPPLRAPVLQVKLLYRGHATEAAGWKLQVASLEKRLAAAREDAEAFRAANQELSQGLQAARQLAASPEALQVKYVETVQRAAIVQVGGGGRPACEGALHPHRCACSDLALCWSRSSSSAGCVLPLPQIKHARAVRQLDAAQVAEASLTERTGGLERDLADLSATSRARIHWLELAATDAGRRVEQLYAQLQASAPLDAHQALVAKHAMLQVRGACLPAWHAAPAAAAAHAARILQRACAPHSTCLHGRPAAVELALACR